jgi:hypothetical protein
VCLLAWLVVGCGCGQSLRLEGKWLGSRPVESDPDADPAVVTTLSKVDLRIGANGRFTLFERGLPKGGVIRYAGAKAFLEVNELVGRPLAKQPKEVRDQFQPIELTPQKDGSLLYRDPAILEQPIVLKRVSPQG